MRKLWTLTLDGEPHTVEIEHGFWSGARTIFVDGRQVHRSVHLIDFGSNTAVQVSSHRVNVIVGTNGFTFRYDIAVDGISEATGKPVAVQPTHMPWWGWVFAAACLAIPVYTGGGIFPVLIGVIGTLMVSSYATDAALDVRQRVLRCLSVTMAAWAALMLIFILFV